MMVDALGEHNRLRQRIKDLEAELSSLREALGDIPERLWTEVGAGQPVREIIHNVREWVSEALCSFPFCECGKWCVKCGVKEEPRAFQCGEPRAAEEELDG